jgi:hypothetical protein
MQRFRKIFLFILSYSLMFNSYGAVNNQDCQDVLNWIYKELTLNNLDKSVERLNKKLQASFLYALKNSENSNLKLKDNPELVSLFESLQKIDPDFESYLEDHNPYRKYKSWSWWWWNSVDTEDYSYKEITQKWIDFQKKNSQLFYDMPNDLKLDEWDITTSDILDKVQATNIVNPEQKEKFQALASQYNKNLQELIKPKGQNIFGQILETKKDVDDIHKVMGELIKEIYNNNIDEFESLCAESDLLNLLSKDSLVCNINDVPGSDLSNTLSLKLKDLSDVVNSDFINTIQKPTLPIITVPEELEPEIKPHDYDNVNYAGSFCLREENIVDTAVIHHTATSNDFSPQDINDTQVVAHENDVNSNGDPDPWYMIAYNYAITSDYNSNNATVHQGRPDKMKGAHAGGYVNVDQLDPVVQNLVKDYNFICGYNRDQDSEHIIDERDKATEKKYKKELKEGFISANMTSVGVAVIGNYMPDLIRTHNGYSPNPSGYPSNGPVRYPTDDALKKVGQLICKLKKEKYPNLRKITDHNFIKIKKALADGTATNGTCCPGSVYYRMQKIKELAMEACNFKNNEFVLDISPKVNICRGLKDIQ